MASSRQRTTSPARRRQRLGRAAAYRGRARLLPSRLRTKRQAKQARVPREESPRSKAAARAGEPLRILITAGPTREYLDTVRFLSNPSSGKMGYAIAEAAGGAGHKVVLVSGPVAIKPPKGVKFIQVTSAAEMASAARSAFVHADAAVFAAAVCDYRPVHRALRKLPKAKRRFALTLAPTIDIAAALGRAKGRRVTIAFALEDHDARHHAEAKMLRKKSDAIVLNGPATVGSELTCVEFLEWGGAWQRWGACTKRMAARRLVHVLERLARQAASPLGDRPAG